ncbi:P2Y purinoceptor 3 [Anguilla anguilla]|uniref:P2Y purinoceptor 3 n=1 Tax=Anguilla anguilla TaxID=7936 RepID=UPI0015AAC40E|nr:P2Y purinoceptor 3 [Anguilla anguilla]
MKVSVSVTGGGNSTASGCSIDESYKYVFLPLCYSFTFLCSLSLNSVVLLRAYRRSRRWNASLVYMANLAATDLMYGLSLPFLVASYVMRDRWVFGDFMCRLVRFLFYFNLYCSIYFLTCVSVHRYLGICHPMKTITLETKRAAKGTCGMVWAVVFVLTSPIFRFAQTGYVMRGGGAKGGAGPAETFQNCWDDAIDEEFSEYVPYGIILHLLGFFVPFVIIAWCYSHVVLTIFRALRSQPHLQEGGAGGGAVSGPACLHIRRRRKSIRTIVTITLLFALCFLPFHVTRTLFLVLKGWRGVRCDSMRAVSICYKVTRPLASFNAWLNALLYFITKDKSAPCCPRHKPSHRALLWPLRMLGGVAEREGPGGGGGAKEKENESKSSGNIF